MSQCVESGYCTFIQLDDDLHVRESADTYVASDTAHDLIYSNKTVCRGWC